MAAAAAQHDAISALLDLDLDEGPSQSAVAAAAAGDPLSDLLGGAAPGPAPAQQLVRLC